MGSNFLDFGCILGERKIKNQNVKIKNVESTSISLVSIPGHELVDIFLGKIYKPEDDEL
jgi:hypothetical protein